MTDGEIQQHRLIDCSLILSVDQTVMGHTRMQTTFLYPDGSNVDIFIKNERDLLSPVEPITLTDFGNTISWLSNLQILPSKSKRRSALMADILETYGVVNRGGSLELKIDREKVTLGIIRLGQACLRLADFYYTTRFVAQNRFNEEVEELLTDWNMEYLPDAEISGRFGNVVKVDFAVKGRKSDTAILTLSADKYPSAARQRAEHVFAVFSDLVEWQGQRVAALDSREKAYSEIDLERVATVATVVPVFADLATFHEILLAA